MKYLMNHIGLFNLEFSITHIYTFAKLRIVSKWKQICLDLQIFVIISNVFLIDAFSFYIYDFDLDSSD